MSLKMSGQAKKPETRKVKCAPDTLDGAFLAVARLGGLKSMAKDDVLGYAMALALHILATAIIFIVTVAMRATVLQKARAGITKTELVGKMASVTAFMDKPLTVTFPYFQTDVNATGTAHLKSFLGMCDNQEAHVYLHYLMMFLWLAFIGPKLLDAFDRVNILVTLDTKGIDDVADVEITKKGLGLDRLDCVSKLLVFFVVLLPHIVTNLLAAWVGLQFLAMEGAVGTLLMKALIMKAVTAIEAPVFKNFASSNLRGFVKASTYVLAVDPGSKKQETRIVYNTWGSPILKFLVFFFIGVIYTKTQWADLNDFRGQCSEMFEKMGTDSVEMKCIAQGIPGNSCARPWR